MVQSLANIILQNFEINKLLDIFTIILMCELLEAVLDDNFLPVFSSLI